MVFAFAGDSTITRDLAMESLISEGHEGADAARRG
jgi:hypothetical protein